MAEGQESPPKVKTDVETKKDFKVQVAPEKEIKEPEYTLRFQDGGKVPLEIDTGPKKFQREGPWRVEKQEKSYINPRFSEELPLGSVLHIGGRYFEVVEPVGNKKKMEERFGGSVYVSPIGPDVYQKKKEEGVEAYDDETGNIPYSESYRAERVTR